VTAIRILVGLTSLGTVLTFALVRSAPTDPGAAATGEAATGADLRHRVHRRRFHL
jgi:hypothetical protein